MKTRSVLSAEPLAAYSDCASTSGTCSSSAPCTMRNGQRIFCTTPSRRNGSSRRSASSSESTPRIHMMWWPGTDSEVLN
ncbi:MAG: hypothetical protein ACK559_11920, partial [bacterium]